LDTATIPIKIPKGPKTTGATANATKAKAMLAAANRRPDLC
jgi:hypothetical protein